MAKLRPDPRQAAEIIAIKALGFVAGDTERIGRFLAESGLGPETLRAAATDPQFLTGVLDFILRDESLVVAFAAAEELRPDQIRTVRDILGGPAWERDGP
jgi:hypothetical protein